MKNVLGLAALLPLAADLTRFEKPTVYFKPLYYQPA